MAFAAAACGPGPAPPGFQAGSQTGDVVVGANEEHGGNLAAEFDFSTDVEVSLSATLAGFDLYTASEPGFDTLALDEPDESFFVVEQGTEIVFEITSIDAGAAVEFDDAILDEVGDTAVLGATPDLQVHPEWRVVVPEGSAGGDFTVGFRLTSPAGVYGPSEEYVITLATAHAE